MEFRILGPLEVEEGSVQVVLGAEKQRALLAVLLLDANHTVSVDRLIDDLWGGGAPERADKAIQTYVSRLRKVLPGGTLRTRSPGYVLELESEQLEGRRAVNRAQRENRACRPKKWLFAGILSCDGGTERARFACPRVKKGLICRVFIRQGGTLWARKRRGLGAERHGLGAMAAPTA